MEQFGPDAGGCAVREDERVIRFEQVPEYAEFLERCLVPNRPCILPPGLVAHWNVVRSRAWQRGSEEEEGVDWQALERDFGSHVAPVVISKLQANGEMEEVRSDMSISDAVKLIEGLNRGNAMEGVQSIYIKDWHLIKQLGKNNPHNWEEPYTVPELFADDWMNNLAPPASVDASGGEGEGKVEMDDFRFVYAGTAGSQTLLHRDVYTSYSWSTNIVGRKRWYLFPPRAAVHLRRFPTVSTSPLLPDIQTLLQTLDSPGCSDTDRTPRDYPNLNLAWSQVQIIDQHAHQTLFVPSDWYHQVSNLTESISINRNWCNAVNIPSLYRSIVAELAHVQDSLCDVRDMLAIHSPNNCNREFYALVQDVAIKDAGWAWAGFWSMLLHNLRSPATGARKDLRPSPAWLKQRLLPLVDEFEQREDAKWLEEELRSTVQKCRVLLEQLDV